MAPRLQSTALLVLVVLVTVCSLHVDHVTATNGPSGSENCSKDMRCRMNQRNGLRKCPSYPNAIPTCKDGCCSAECKPGYADCNLNMNSDGCETFIGGEDRENCGGCGEQCPFDKYPTAVASCTGGKCGILMCFRGSTDCNGKVEDGCEEYTDTDVNNCGSCSRRCSERPNTVPICEDGTCYYLCKEGFRFCGGSALIDERGCSSLDTDVNNCGSCNNVCAAGQSCQHGVCTN